MSRWFVVIAAVTLGLFAGSCGKEWTFDGVIGDCWDKNDVDFNAPSCVRSRCRLDAGAVDETDVAYNEAICIKKRCELDAGADGCDAGTSSSSSSSGSSAVCPGTCVPNAPNYFVGPEIVYIGQAKAKYVFEDDGYDPCPSGAGSLGDRQWTDLYIPPPGCPACICGPIEGSCAPPKEISVRSNICDAQPADSLDFSGPDAWDGLCTNVNAVPGGLECPPNSGVPCAQSILSSPLPAPIQGCKPIPLPVVNATNDAPTWKKMVLSCNANATNESCDDSTATKCLPPLPKEEDGWRYCVRSQDKGVFPCPGGSYGEQFLAYDEFIDTRKCTECVCEAFGGACSGTLRVYKDDTCSTNELSADLITSDMSVCANVPPGEAIGSKEVTDLMYEPGKCEPTGGEPIGTVTEVTTKILPDGLEHATVTTWCCQPLDKNAGASME